MPELPETETIARDLDAGIRGVRVVGTVVHRADVLREADAEMLARAVNGCVIAHVWRRAKMVVLDLVEVNAAPSDETLARHAPDRTAVAWHLVVQPRFTGGLLIDEGETPPDPALLHLAVTFDLADGRRLHYRDVRRLGTVALMSPRRFVAYSGAIGPEPLDPAFGASDVSALVRSSHRAIKIVLMDQRALAGVGNIYASEALWRAGIDPSREAGSLSAHEAQVLCVAIQDVLRASIVARGTSFRDYRDAHGERGAFVHQLAVYGRAELPCHRCGHRLVGTHAIDGRSTVFCAWCQR